MLVDKKISCHHGDYFKPNELLPAINILNKYKDIDIIEIDFVYYNNNFISSHDYDLTNINKGSLLSEWIDVVVKLNKILWIDLKDDTLSIFTPFTQLDIAKLIDLLNNIKNVKDYVIIGCQYGDIYKQLLQYKHLYTIIKDCPRDMMYVLDIVTPKYLTNVVNYVAEWDIIYNLDDVSIMALDRKFFNSLTEIEQFTSVLKIDTIIIYNFDKDDVLPIIDKHVILQFNYF